MAIAALIGAGLMAASKVQEGRNEKAWSDYQAQQMMADAQAEKGAAQVHAENIRKVADKQRSQARAAMAASGVDVSGIGTPLQIDSKIAGDAEHDAFITLLGGEQAVTRARQGAYGTQLQGKRAQQAGYLGAATSMLSTGGSMYSGYGGWKVK